MVSNIGQAKTFFAMEEMFVCMRYRSYSCDLPALFAILIFHKYGLLYEIYVFLSMIICVRKYIYLYVNKYVKW